MADRDSNTHFYKRADSTPQPTNQTDGAGLSPDHIRRALLDTWAREPKASESPAKTSDDVQSANKGTPGLLPDWNERHQALVDKAKSTDPAVAFYGDSITEAMHLNNSFKSLFNGKSENFGIHSDTTDNLRYRLLNGEASFAGGKNPTDVVMHIGTNDMDTPKTPEKIASDIFADAMLAHKKLPDSQILVVGIMPRPGYENKIAKINKMVSERIENEHDPKLRFKDIGSSMPEGAPGVWQPGGLHPTYQVGYTRMLNAIKKALNETKS